MSAEEPTTPPLLWGGMAAAILATIAAAVILVRVAPSGQPGTASQSALATDERPRQPGVLATIRAGETSVERRLPAPSFALEPGQSLDARVPAGPFEARFEVTFHPGPVRRARVGARVSGGTLSIERAGRPVATTADAEGRVTSSQLYFPDRTSTLTYTFRADGEGPVLLRALWQPDTASAPMPLPAQGGEWARDTQVAGLALAQRYGCAACHAAADPALQALLTSDPAPVLGAVGARARPSWIRRWLSGPHDLKPGSPMPALLRGPGDAEAVEDLVHFLASLGGPVEEPDHELDGDLVATGDALFHGVGCFACHEATALGPLGAKTTPAALAAFLLDPVSVRPSGRMPAQNLTELEAQALASYLIAANPGASSAGEPFTPDPARVGRGRAAFSARGCAACHALGPDRPTIASTLAAPGLGSLDPRDPAGCLSPHPVAGAPHFDLEESDRLTLAAFLRALPDRACRDVPIDRLGATLVRLDCLACHRVHEAGGPPDDLQRLFQTAAEIDAGDEGRLPPDLSDAGGRFTQRWLTGVLEESASARPYMEARMPQFGGAVSGLAPLFAAASGVRPHPDEGPDISAADASAGRDLVGAGAFNCIQCHSIAGRDATATPGPDLVAMPERLRYDHFRTWLADPKLTRPGTRMPTFFAEGRSGLTEHYGGDADRQIAAIWAYLSQGDLLPLPEGLPDPGQFTLEVGERPIVFRTFMTGIGSRVIACGFPERIHCAFDAERCALRLVWTGRFLNAQGAWAARGGSETDPEQAPVWQAPPESVPLRLAGAGASEPRLRFRGYRLDDAGRPTFHYEVSAGDVTVEVLETPSPDAGGRSLRRHFALQGPPGTRVEGGAGPITLDDRGRGAFTMELSW